MPMGIEAFSDGSACTDPIDSVENVRARLTENLQRDARLAVKESCGANVFDRVLNIRDIG